LIQIYNQSCIDLKDGKYSLSSIENNSIDCIITDPPYMITNLGYDKQHKNKGDTVLDPFMGGGNVGRACNNLERNFIGFELEQKYFEMARDNINGVVQQKTINKFQESLF